MPEALRKVKQSLGADAVILGTRTLAADGLGRLVGAARYEITAMRASGGAPRPVRSGATPPAVRAFHVRLVQHQVAAHIAERLLEAAAADLPAGRSVTESDVRVLLRRYIAGMVPAEPGGTLTGRVAFVGPTGGGKTTTLAKLAAQARFRGGKRVALLSLDVHRIGACAQLGRYAELIGVPFRSAATPEAIAEALDAMRDAETILIDTPGVGLTAAGPMRDLRRLLSASHPDATHLVLPASLSSAAQARTCETFRAAGATRIVLTKLDDAVGLGAILGVLEQAKMKLSYVTTGQRVPTDIGPACSERLAELILP